MQAPQAKNVHEGQLVWDQGRRVWLNIVGVTNEQGAVTVHTVFGTLTVHPENRVPVIDDPNGESPDA